jgi:transcriptional regulator with PAS, ATPase and Fis domain
MNNQNLFEYFDELPSAITVADKNAIIIYMNKKALLTFANDGGSDLIGKSLYDCHNENSNTIIRQILEEGISNTYTIEKNGLKKLIHQTPWLKDNAVAGVIEFSIVIPFDMPHFKRD